MSSPATYNRNAIGTIWNLADLPAEWPGYAILLKGDLDRDLVIEPNELDDIDWIAFSEAVEDCQQRAGLASPDGKLGPKTLQLFKEQYGTAPAQDGVLKRVGDLVLCRATRPTAPPPQPVPPGRNEEERRICDLWNRYGAAIGAQADVCGVSIEAALAVFSVESGTAYDPGSGLVIIRFEPHIFLKKSGRESPWARGGQSTEWRNFETAYGIDPQAALLSTSYGLPQLMGFNVWVTRFRSAREMLLAFQDSCLEQVAGFFGFVKKNALEQYVAGADWRSFARRYNGPGAVDDYSSKLIRAMKVIASLQQDGARFAP